MAPRQSEESVEMVATETATQTPDHIHFLERTRKIKFWIAPDVSHPFLGCDGLSARFDAQSAAIFAWD